MRLLEVKGLSRDCMLALGETIANLDSYCRGLGSSTQAKPVIITDTNVMRCHKDRLQKYETIVLEPGEANKTLATVERVYARLMELGIERESFVVGVGGGIVCDITGFAASTYLRGVRFGFVPTTLLSQVDASVGGKNGVNFIGYKNLVGVIRQPEFCIFDFELLRTLPKSEMRCGFAEVVKHAVIGDASLFSFLETSWQDAFSLKHTAIEKVVHDSLAVKIRIVQKDENEEGERMKLNFGHTIAHAIEKVAGIAHGEAVSIGMVAEARFAVRKGALADKEAERIAKLLSAIGLPVSLDGAAIGSDARQKLADAISKDKKRASGNVKMALLDKIGSCSLGEVGQDEIESSVKDLREHR